MGIFTRFWPTFGVESHKIARYLVLNVDLWHTLMLFRQYAIPSKYLQYLWTSYENVKIGLKSAQMGIFTRIWPNFGFQSHKIVRNLVLNVSMSHYDVFETVCNAECLQSISWPLRTHMKTGKSAANGYFYKILA